MTRTKLAVFRVDSSLQIGNGHVMRCLTLAAALRELGTECHFICREHPGNLIDQVRDQGFSVTTLAPGRPDFHPVTRDGESLPAHAAWLGIGMQADAEVTRNVLQSRLPDWLVVDHYALDHSWEHELRPYCRHLMVIDDLADRPHDCDLLLDQNLRRAAANHVGLVPRNCTLLVGTRYALLRPEFAALRDYSLQRRNPPRLHHLLISMGGVDQSNGTGQVLDALRECSLPTDCRITVVMGLHAPWLRKVQARAKGMPWPCEVRVNVSDMAQLMADSDLAIGAAGSTSWERCAMGLPMLVVVLAENQENLALALGEARAACVIKDVSSVAEAAPNLLATIGDVELAEMSQAARILCDGCGTPRVVGALVGHGCRVRRMREDDLVNVLNWRNHPDVRRFMYSQHEISHAEHRAWYERTKKDSRHHLLIVEDDVDAALGFVQFIEQGNGVAKWGFYAVPDAPRGSGRKLGTAALNHAFNRMAFDKICGEAIACNERSMTLHHELGFRDEGASRHQYFDDDHYYDVRCFSVLAHEWHKRH